MDNQDETSGVGRSEINRLKLVINPFIGPAYVVCGLGCSIGGFWLTQSYWHWPTWLVIVVAVPVSTILGWILTALVVIGLGLFKDKHHV